MLGNYDLELLEHRVLSDQDGLLVLAAKDFCERAKPGQFAMLSSGPTLDPFLRRAISICDCRDGKVFFAYRLVGKGTHYLRSLEAGDRLEVLGPLGRGFEIDFEDENVLLLGGGIGMAPFVFLARRLLDAGNRVHMRIGGQTKEAVRAGFELFKDLACEYSYTTDDGSYGIHGIVTAELNYRDFDRVCACGPTPMLRAVRQDCLDARIPCQISLEGKMGCGVGVCLACTCENAKNPDLYHKVCTQGPVFWAEEVVL